jgi:hypothetical protein
MKLGFLDFWHLFDEKNNFFVDIISSFLEGVQVSSPEDCDILIFSCYGYQNLLPQYQNKKRIFYTGENLRPVHDIDKSYRTQYNTYVGYSDFSLSFDYEDYGGKNIRLPLWLLQIDWFGKNGYRNPKYVIPYNELYENSFQKKSKDGFACIVFNSDSPYRYEIIEKLSKYKTVDCYGKPFGNWFDGEDTKLNIISDYKFNICFENSLYPGYYTEKLIHAKVAGCIPIYWSDHNASKDFNTRSFINLSDFKSIDDLVEYIIEVDSDDEAAKKYTQEKMFDTHQDPKILFESIIKKIEEKISLSK